MNAAEYHHAVLNHDRNCALAELDALPKNINPTGDKYRKHYKRVEAKYNVTL